MWETSSTESYNWACRERWEAEKTWLESTKILITQIGLYYGLILRETHNNLNGPKLKIKNREYKTLPVQYLNILRFQITASLRRRSGGGGGVRCRAGGKGGKHTERTRKVATPKRKAYTHKAKCWRREEKTRNVH